MYDDDDDATTWDDGHYTEDDVIESADHTGYLSVDDYVHDVNGMDPDE
jgi:hypothetical protein